MVQRKIGPSSRLGTLSDLLGELPAEGLRGDLPRASVSSQAREFSSLTTNGTEGDFGSILQDWQEIVSVIEANRDNWDNFGVPHLKYYDWNVQGEGKRVMQTEAATGEGTLLSHVGRGCKSTTLASTVAVDESSRGTDGAVAHAESVREMVRPSHIGTFSQLLAGGIAGAVSKTCTAPLARLTILFQVQGMHSDTVHLTRPRIHSEASRIFREEGLRAFWKGNGVTIVHRLPYSSVNFFAYEQYKMYLRSSLGIEDQESIGVNMGTRLVAGGAAGVTAATLTYPLDVVRTRLAAQTKVMYYNGITHALHRIHREEGIRGLYKGMGTTLLGVGPNIAINFCVYETLKSLWLEKSTESSPLIVSLGCGSIAGICSSTATFPIDLVRRRMQLEGAGGKARVYKSGLASTFGHIVRTEGWFGLYRGIIPEYYKVIPSVGIVFMTYEFMKQVFRPRSWDEG